MNLEHTARRFIKRLEGAYYLHLTADQALQLRGGVLSMLSNAMVAKRDSSCIGKIRYDTKSDAYRAYLALYAADAAMSYYKCPFCLGWHLGHKDRKGDE